MLRRLDNPNERKSAGCSSAISEAGNNIPYMRHLVYNTNTSGPEHDSAIGYKIFAA